MLRNVRNVDVFGQTSSLTPDTHGDFVVQDRVENWKLELAVKFWNRSCVGDLDQTIDSS